MLQSNGSAIIHHDYLAIAAFGVIAGKEQDGVGLIVHRDLWYAAVKMLAAQSGKFMVKGGHLLRGV